MSNTSQNCTQTEREFSRVDTCLPFEVSLVPDEERMAIRSRSSISPSIVAGQMPEPEDEAVAIWLRTINSKLDAILNQVMFQKEGFLCLRMRTVNISAGGMRFKAEQPFKVGDIVEVKMMLQAFNPVALYLYGKVVGTGPCGVGTGPCGSEKQFDTAIQFIEMDDEIANIIVRYVFEVQRGQIRKRKE